MAPQESSEAGTPRHIVVETLDVALAGVESPTPGDDARGLQRLADIWRALSAEERVELVALLPSIDVTPVASAPTPARRRPRRAKRGQKRKPIAASETQEPAAEAQSGKKKKDKKSKKKDKKDKKKRKKDKKKKKK
ncbi:MAG TPA: hypothetical protein VEZ11_08865 [Thermoanaerobaculia bacterium]|nr:hypothetical protein [Thermoanaerobaculia bacterium]